MGDITRNMAVGGLLCFFEIWKKLVSLTKYTGVCDVFSDFEMFEKAQIRGRIRKREC